MSDPDYKCSQSRSPSPDEDPELFDEEEDERAGEEPLDEENLAGLLNMAQSWKVNVHKKRKVAEGRGQHRFDQF